MRRNLCKCDESVKSTAYLSLVRPTLEYASSVWDPYLSRDVNALERVQRIAARWVKSNYDWESSVTSMLTNLQWPVLSLRRKVSRLSMIYKGLFNIINLEIPEYITKTTTTCHTTRYQHPLHFMIPTARTNYYHNSFFPRTLRDWNSLPINIIESKTLKSFLDNLSNL